MVEHRGSLEEKINVFLGGWKCQLIFQIALKYLKSEPLILLANNFFHVLSDEFVVNR